MKERVTIESARRAASLEVDVFMHKWISKSGKEYVWDEVTTPQNDADDWKIIDVSLPSSFALLLRLTHFHCRTLSLTPSPSTAAARDHNRGPG